MPLSHLKILGVINLTPDSFSDSGVYLSGSHFIATITNMVSSGADMIDLGGESTRPGAEHVTYETEWGRLLPGIKSLPSGLSISIDTRKEEIALKALENYPISMINCMAGVFSRPLMIELLRLSRKVGINLQFCAGHMHGSPATMQQNPLTSRQVIAEIEGFMEQSLDSLLSVGFKEENIYLDPGVGFGKSDPANLSVLAKTAEWSTKYNLMLGVSRKGIIGRMLSIEEPLARDQASKILETSLALMGAKYIRTHDVLGLSHIRSLARESNG